MKTLLLANNWGMCKIHVDNINNRTKTVFTDFAVTVQTFTEPFKL